MGWGHINGKQMKMSGKSMFMGGVVHQPPAQRRAAGSEESRDAGLPQRALSMLKDGRITSGPFPPVAFLSFAACQSDAATNRLRFSREPSQFLSQPESNANDHVASFYSTILFWFSVRSWCIDDLMLDCMQGCIRFYCMYINVHVYLQQLWLWFRGCMCAETGPVFGTLKLQLHYKYRYEHVWAGFLGAVRNQEFQMPASSTVCIHPHELWNSRMWTTSDCLSICLRNLCGCICTSTTGWISR